MKHRVFNLSGGRSSAMMTILLKPTSNDIVIFNDTGREVDGTYKFLDDIEKWEGIKIHRVMYSGGFSGMIKKEKYVPNITRRICTKNLKVLTAKRFLRNRFNLSTFHNYIGFRADEPNRVLEYKSFYKKVVNFFPLHEMGITKPDVIKFWSQKPYDLHIPDILGNCDLCFLKGKAAIIRILQHYPELADKWIKDEQENGHTFLKDVSYSQLLESAKKLPIKELTELKPAFSCSCTN